MKIKISKKYLLVIALLLMAGIFMSSQALAYEPEVQVTAPAIVNTAVLNVRAGPGAEYSVVDIVRQGDVVTMTGRNADASWVFIRTPSNIEGWVNTTLLTFNVNPFNLPVVGTTQPATATATPQAVQPIAIYGVVNTGALNVRSGPSPQFSVIDAVYFGETVLLGGRNADSTWVFGTTPDNVNGWMNVRYLTLSSPVTMLPVVSGSTPATPGIPITPLPTIPAATPAPTTVPNTAVVTSGNLNVRSGPGVGYTRVTALGNGEFVYLAGRNLDSTWLLIGNASGQQGWVNSKYLSSSTNITTLPIASQTGTAHVTAGNLNLRSGPGPGYSVVTVAPYGSSVVMQGRSSDNTWFLIRAGNGKEGWANGSFLTTTMDVNQLPTLSGPVPGQPSLPTLPTQPTLPSQPTNPGNTASIRSCPNVSCPATGSVYSGLTVTATGRTADSSWVYVKLSNGQEGWIQAQFVVLGIPLNTLPIVTTSPTG